MNTCFRQKLSSKEEYKVSPAQLLFLLIRCIMYLYYIFLFLGVGGVRRVELCLKTSLLGFYVQELIKNGCCVCKVSCECQISIGSLGLPFWRDEGRLWQKVLEIIGFSSCFPFDELICVYSHIEFHLNKWKFKMAKRGKILHSTHF